jgi:hypothetical protein
VSETHVIDLSPWSTPPCPRCGSDAANLCVEEHDDDFFAPARITRARDMWLQPCGHAIAGYTVQGDEVRWMVHV